MVSLMKADYIIEQPTLLMVVGVPASGKTKLLDEIAESIINVETTSKDDIQKRYTDQRVTGDDYSVIRWPTRQEMFKFADSQLESGKIPGIDAPFSVDCYLGGPFSNWAPFFRYVAWKHDARLAVIRCVPSSQEEQKRRIKERYARGDAPWDEWKLRSDENWAEFQKREPFTFEIRHDDVLEIVTDGPVEYKLKSVLEYLGAERITSTKYLVRPRFD